MLMILDGLEAPDPNDEVNDGDLMGIFSPFQTLGKSRPMKASIVILVVKHPTLPSHVDATILDGVVVAPGW